MDPAVQFIYEKALKYAKLSYLGIIIPAAGVTLSIISNTLAGSLTPRTPEDRENIEYVVKLAKWGFVASLWPVWLYLIFLVIMAIGALV